MDPDFLHAINGDWDALLTAMRDSRALMRRTDASGMTILHWVCMHQSAPTDIVVKVIFANPQAVHMRNDAGHLPIDLAVQAECGQRIIEVLRAAAHGSREHAPSGGDLQPYDDDPSMEVSDYQLPFGGANQHASILDDAHGYAPQQPRHYYDEQDDDEFAYFQQLQEQQRQQLQQQQQQRQQYELEMVRNQRSLSRDRLMMGDLSSPSPSSSHQLAKYPYSPQDAALGQYPLYGNGGGRGSMGNLSHRSDQLKSMALTEQRLRERENDLISVATDDNTPLGYDAHQSHELAMLNQFGVPEPEMAPTAPNGGAGAGAGSRPRSKTTFPPRWKQARSCHVCSTIFSLVKRRHHCRNCGQSVCGQHSTNRVSLPKFGLSEPQRVCDKCFLSGHHMMAGPPGPPSVAESFQSHSQFIRAHYG